MIVTAMSAEQLKTIFAFHPLIDVFLKERLFADILARVVLTYTGREPVTVSSLASMHDAFVNSHIGGALNVVVTKQQRGFDFVGDVPGFLRLQHQTRAQL
ncbi:MAG: hypothetical protein ABIQ88_23065 [Chitinophagaceae bacterium]